MIDVYYIGTVLTLQLRLISSWLKGSSAFILKPQHHLRVMMKFVRWIKQNVRHCAQGAH